MGRKGGTMPLVSVSETACMAIKPFLEGGTCQACISAGGSILLHHISPVYDLLGQTVAIQGALSVR